MDYAHYPLLAALASIPMIGMGFYLWRVRRSPGVRKLFYLVVAVLGWLLLNTLELVDPTPEGSLRWAKLTYFLIASVPVLWLLFVMDYHDQPEWLKPARQVLVSILPAATVLLVLTNEYHHLIWKTVSFFSVGGFLALKVTYGPFFWVAWSYNLILLLFGGVVLIRDNLNHFDVYRWQVAWIGAGLLIAVSFNVVYVLRIFPWLKKDYTPVAMALAVLCIAIAMTRFRLFDTVPLGRSVLFDSIDEAVLAVGPDGGLTDIDPAAYALFGLPKSEPGGTAAAGSSDPFLWPI